MEVIGASFVDYGKQEKAWIGMDSCCEMVIDI